MSTTRQSSLVSVARLTSEEARKITAYDAARATVKIEGGTRAEYVLRAEAAEAEVERLMRVYKAAADLCDDPFGSLDQRKFYKLREAFYA